MAVVMSCENTLYIRLNLQADKQIITYTFKLALNLLVNDADLVSANIFIIIIVYLFIFFFLGGGGAYHMP